MIDRTPIRWAWFKWSVLAGVTACLAILYFGEGIASNRTRGILGAVGLSVYAAWAIWTMIPLRRDRS